MQGNPDLDLANGTITFNVSIISQASQLKFSDGVAHESYEKAVNSTRDKYAQVRPCQVSPSKTFFPLSTVHSPVEPKPHPKLAQWVLILVTFAAQKRLRAAVQQILQRFICRQEAPLLRCAPQALSVTAIVNPGAYLTNAALFLDVNESAVNPAAVPAPAPTPAPTPVPAAVVAVNNGFGSTITTLPGGGGARELSFAFMSGCSLCPV